MLNIYNQKNNNHNGDLAPDPSSVKKPKIDVGRFEDVTGEFSSSQFKRSYWLATHKVLLYKIIVGVLIFLSVSMWVFSLWNWGDYVVNGITGDIKLSNNLASFPDYSGIKERYAPIPIQVVGANAYVGGSKTYDLIAEVSNPNKNFIVYFDYFFVAGNQRTLTQKGFLFANESYPLVYFGFGEGYPSGVNLIMENVSWKRISTHDIPNVVAWQNDRLNFSVKNFSFSEPQTLDGVTANVIKFDITNNSAFGYRDSAFVVALMQSGSLVGAMPLILKDFKSLETRSIDLRNFSDNLVISDVVVFPLIDIYNQEVYLAPER